MNSEKLFKYCAIAIFLNGLLLSLGASLSISAPLGTDVFYHLELAEEYARGENAMLGFFNMIHNHSPYPPILHLLLVPSVWFGMEFSFTRLLQVVFFSGTLGGLMLAVYKYCGAKTSALSGMILLSSPAFIGETVIQVKPQSLVMLLSVLMLYFYLEDKRKSYLLASIVSVYTWSIASFGFAYGLLAYRIREKKWFITALLFVIACLPLAFLTLKYSDFPAMFSRWGNEQGTLGVTVSPKLLILQNPLYLILYLGSPILGIPCLVWSLAKWKTQTKYTRALSIILLSSFPLAIIWVDRWVQCSSLFLTFLFADWLSKRKGFVYGFISIILLTVFIFWSLNYWWVTATGNWFSAGSNTWWNAP